MVDLTGCDSYIVNGAVDELMEAAVFKTVVPTSDKCCVFLTTYGGSADVAYRVMRFLQRKYPCVAIAIVGKCKSAGTIMALGADTLLMAETGELGPLDVQIMDGVKSSINSGLDFGSALSVSRQEVVGAFASAFQTMRAAKLSRMHAIEAAGRIAQSVASALYSQVDPVTIGASQRSIAVAMEYGMRLSKRSHSISQSNLQRLIAGYPSHSFCIDREEARTLFNSVESIEDHPEIMDIYGDQRANVLANVQNGSLVLKVPKNDENQSKINSSETAVKESCAESKGKSRKSGAGQAGGK